MADATAAVMSPAKAGDGAEDLDRTPSAEAGNKFQAAISAWRSMSLQELFRVVGRC